MSPPPDSPSPRSPSTRAAWRRPTRQQVFLALAFALLVSSVLVGAVAQLLAGSDERVVVVDLALGHDPERREALRQECGRLPGVELVADRGSPAQASRFPARFSIAGSTPPQAQALQSCIQRYDDIVMGSRLEGRA